MPVKGLIPCVRLPPSRFDTLVAWHERGLAHPPRSIQEAVAWADDVQRLRHQIQLERRSLELSNRAAAVWLSWCREIGLALSRMPLQAGNRTPGSQRATPRLRDLGLTKRRSAECQRLAKIPNDYFQDYLWNRIHEGRELSMAEAQRVAAGFRERTPVARRPRWNGRETAIMHLDDLWDIADAATEAVGRGPQHPEWTDLLLSALDLAMDRVGTVIPIQGEWARVRGRRGTSS